MSLVGKTINRFNFFIYPDSYYYLLIAENLRSNMHPVGTLGPGGQPFPPEGYAAMKTAFPAMVALTTTTTGLGSEAAGHLVAALAAVGVVFVAYFATWRLMASRAVALTAALLVATSYGLTYWSGFVMSDSLSVFLGFLAIAMIAKTRPDEWSNPGDIMTGTVFALLTLSRPTYLVALPALLWLGARSFGWTRKRVASAMVSALLFMSLVAVMWFPPVGFGMRLVRNLLPVLGAALLVAAVGLALVRHLKARESIGRLGQIRGPMMLAALAAVIPLVYGLERAVVLVLEQPSPFGGLHRFVIRDPATLIALIPGAVMLSIRGRREIAGPLLIAATVLLGVYFWVEPRESRYLIHLLPFLVPVAASSTLLVTHGTSRTDEGSSERSSRLPDSFVVARKLALGLVVAVIAVAVLRQGQQSLSQAKASFLKTDYPREVSARVASSLRDDDILVTALPWPYYFRLRVTTWGAGAVYVDEFHEYVDEDAEVILLSDASMRFHYPEIARRAEEHLKARRVAQFSIPTAYQYGYAAVADPKPVSVYRVSAHELRSIVATEAQEQRPSGKVED